MDKFAQVIVVVCVLLKWVVSTSIEFRILEERPVGYFVGNVLTASGLNRNQLEVSLMKQPNGHESYFDIDESTGNLTTKRVIDREVMCEFSDQCELSLKIAAQTTQKDGFFKVIVATIVIEDMNDNAPSFGRTQLDLPISEAVLTGAHVTIDGALDRDMSERYSLNAYQLFPTTPGEGLPFDVSFSKNLDGSSTVRLIVTQQLDREQTDKYQLLIVAKDGGVPPLNGTLLVNIDITDINDNYPEFELPSYNVTVKEDVSLYTNVLKIRAIDRDAGDNGRVFYRLSPHQHAENLKHFALNDISGDLSVIKQLDYNFGIPYKLIVEAIDAGDAPLMSQAFVSVSVLDTGNSAPTINLNLLPSPSNSSVSEYANVGAVVAHVAVEDHDTGRNGDVNCTVLSDFFGLQRYDVKQYKVIVAKTLDRERDDRHNVSVRCEDAGTPALSAWKSFIVSVEDENDNPPRFRQQRYFTRMNENNEIGDRITIVTAFDLDAGNNSKMTYRVPSEYSKYAFVNAATGEVMANRVFDLETDKTKTVEFTVTAEDHGSPALTGTTTVRLTIDDVNDQRPVFDQTLFRFWIDENKPAQTAIGRITAQDLDEGDNAVTRYSLANPGMNIPFTVQPNGMIKTRRGLDRELEPEYTFKVKAVDAADSDKYSIATVTVFVVDINDNVPKLLAPAPGNDTVNVPYMTSPESVIYRVHAEDRDEPGNLNSKLSYWMTAMNKTNYFSINEETGVLILAAPLSNTDLIGKTFIVNISIKDNGASAKIVSSLLRLHVIVDAKPSVGQQDSNMNFIIAIAVASVTIIISAGILITICVIRRLDAKKKATSARSKVLADNMYSKNNDDVDNIYPLQMDSSFPEKKKKEVSFSLEEKAAMEGGGPGVVPGGGDGQGGDALDHILLDPPPQYQQLDLPRASKLDDCHSDMSAESNGDSGKGGSDDDMQGTGLGYRPDDLGRHKDRWNQRQSQQQSPAIQLQSFPTRYTPTNNGVPPQQKIIPFHFKKAPSYSGSGAAAGAGSGQNVNNLSPTGSSNYSVPIYYDDESSRSSSGFQSVDSNSNLNFNNHTGNSSMKLNLNNMRDNMPPDCVV